MLNILGKFYLILINQQHNICVNVLGSILNINIKIKSK